MTRSILVAALLVGLAAVPAQAGGKKEGGSSGSGGESQGAMWAGLPGVREMSVDPPQVSDSLGVVSVNATMWAGSGSAKCRVNFTIENYSSANVSLGFVGRTFGVKDEVVDNWAVSVATLAPNERTGRLFSCALGAVEFMMVPLSSFDWPPVKCVNAAGEAEPCSLTLKIKSTVPIILKKEEKKDDGKDKKPEKKSGH
ncbi:hypothetical protein [Paramagnetospirillum magnetotacticum]|uniref:hypothetical protein n=1 Tax=Paramagnetospirillum magnetotacticum TaxID=188 RepID=UPI001269AB62|nr:hypothetical protein [Paramagnetospirillum magnetotacticum]